MGFVLVFALAIWTVPFAVCLFPDDQPGCHFRPEANFFYAYNAHLGPNQKNWLCENETFEGRLKICIDIYEKTTQGKVETSYEIVRDKESVSKVCEKRKMTFTQEFESGEPEFDKENITIRNTTIDVNMFACPITKMDLRFPIDYLKPELFDIYISLGRNDLTVAALTDSREEDNICIRNVFLYPPKEFRNQTKRSRPFWPEEVRDYKYMNDEYFQNLFRKLYSRKMATATGSAFDYWSTVMHNFTIPENATSPTTEYVDWDYELTTAYDGRHSFEDTSTDDGNEETNEGITSDGDESSEENSTDDGESSEETSTDDGDEETKSSSRSTSEEEGDDVTEVSTTLGHTVIPATKSTSELPSTVATLEVTKATKKAVSRKARVTKSKASSKKARVTKPKASSKKARVTKPKTGSKKATKKRVTTKKVSSTTPPAVS